MRGSSPCAGGLNSDEFEWHYNNRHLFRDTLKALLRSETMTYKALTERPA